MTGPPRRGARRAAPWAHVIEPGCTLTIIDLEGNQAVDCILYNADDPAERYSAPDTIVAQENIFLIPGSQLLSNEGRPMMTVTATSCERHDTIGGACSRESNALRYGFHTRHEHACVDNFLLAHSWRGMGKRDMTSNVNWFMNVPVEADGTLGIVDGISAPGLSVDLRARHAGAGRDLQLPADQQPLQRVRSHADPAPDHPLTVRRVLVANRGEIACRIIRTLTRLGIESVAVFTDVDRDVPALRPCHRRGPDRPRPPAPDTAGSSSSSRWLPSKVSTRYTPATGSSPRTPTPRPRSSTRASSSSGPTPRQIRHFGAKDEARAAAADAGVPLPRGTQPFVDVDAAVAAADAVGFPLLVKSVAGGGGIGMLACDDPAELAATVAQAMQQSRQAFGNPAVFLEQLVGNARHVEVQVFGDGAGTVVTLGERDCSSQRRRQKVLEEAPAPGLDDATRAALADAARALLAPEHYRSAGTVEFVLDVDTGAFHFLEVNTRLQVEHTVTEAITGIDLVEWMVRAGVDVEHELHGPGRAVALRLQQRARAASASATRVARSSPGAGASSSTFCRRRCDEQSRSPSVTTVP